jgi:hypothetical protein
MAKRRTKNVDAMIELLLSRLFRTSNSLQRYMAAKRRAEVKKEKDRLAAKGPKAVKPVKPPKAKGVDLTKPKKLPKPLRPEGGGFDLEPEPPVLA